MRLACCVSASRRNILCATRGRTCVYETPSKQFAIARTRSPARRTHALLHLLHVALRRHVEQIMDVHKAVASQVDWNALREDFPILRQQVRGHELIYFDSAATSQKPRAVVEALRNFYEHDNANVHRGLHTLSGRATDAYEHARQRVAEYIGAASPDEIIFTRGTTESINLVAQAWGEKFIREGDVILLTVMEHHSNLVPWQLLAERKGARLRFLPVRDDGTLDVDQLSSLLTPEVKLFAFTHISNSLGTINPVAELCAKARAVGALTLVDAAQSTGHMPLDVQELGCDFLAFSGHKMCGPTGIGVLYGRAELLDSMPPWQGGGEMIVSVTLEKSTFKKPPHRFEGWDAKHCGRDRTRGSD